MTLFARSFSDSKRGGPNNVKNGTSAARGPFPTALQAPPPRAGRFCTRSPRGATLDIVFSKHPADSGEGGSNNVKSGTSAARVRWGAGLENSKSEIRNPKFLTPHSISSHLNQIGWLVLYQVRTSWMSSFLSGGRTVSSMRSKWTSMWSSERYSMASEHRV